jgi:hypothetical protein
MADLQGRIVQVLAGALSVAVPVLPCRRRDMRSNMEVTLAVQQGLCVVVPMPVPTHALQGAPMVFFDGCEARVQIIELPEVNREGAVDLYDLIEEVALALHWQPRSAESPLAGMLAHPLTLAERPVEMAEGVVEVPGWERSGDVIRSADIVFNAVLQINEE